MQTPAKHGKSSSIHEVGASVSEIQPLQAEGWWWRSSETETMTPRHEPRPTSG